MKRMTRHRHMSSPLLRQRQTGVALLVALVLLVAVTLLGVSAMQGTIMQERMSANQRDVEEAFNLAELALSRGEQTLQDQPTGFLGIDPLNDPSDLSEDDDNVTPLTDDDLEGINLDDIAENPMFHIAEIGVICPPGADLGTPCDELYGITARGTGRSDNTRVVLRSIYRMTP